MADEILKNSTHVDIETASVIAQILSDILDDSSIQSIQSYRPNNLQPNQILRNDDQQPTCSTFQQEGDSTYIKPSQSDKDTIRGCKSSEDGPNTIPFQTCTVKEMLNHILDCTVIQRPSLLIPSTSANTNNERNLLECLTPPLGYNPGINLAQRQDSYIETNSNESFRMQYTVKEVLSEIMNCTVFNKRNRQLNVYDFSVPGTSRTRSEYFEPKENIRRHIYRTHGVGIINSENAIHDEAYIRKPSGISIQNMLPSYSTVIRMGPPPKIKSHQSSSSSFVPRLPPPSYAEVEGIWEDGPSLISSESAVFGPDPTYMVCPRCRTVVITAVQIHRSVMTHVVALLLCLCLCWPCCLMPYCLRSCNYSYHTCPNCSHYFGMYRPF